MTLLRYTLIKYYLLLRPQEKKDALSYRLETREKQTQLEWFKVVASYLLSNIGLFALTVLYAIIGKLDGILSISAFRNLYLGDVWKTNAIYDLVITNLHQMVFLWIMV